MTEEEEAFISGYERALDCQYSGITEADKAKYDRLVNANYTDEELKIEISYDI